MPAYVKIGLCRAVLHAISLPPPELPKGVIKALLGLRSAQVNRSVFAIAVRVRGTSASDRYDSKITVSRCESLHVVEIVGRDDRRSELHRRCHHERVDGMGAG